MRSDGRVAGNNQFAIQEHIKANQGAMEPSSDEEYDADGDTSDGSSDSDSELGV